MSRDDVIRMALECGLLDARDDVLRDDGIAQFVGTLTDFAALAAQQEREACAKVAEGFEQSRDWVRGSLYESIRNEVAARIRARGAQRCPGCRYQHGHAIGCMNNPVDAAIRATIRARGEK